MQLTSRPQTNPSLDTFKLLTKWSQIGSLFADEINSLLKNWIFHFLKA